jgi:hypothetical protein
MLIVEVIGNRENTIKMKELRENSPKVNLASKKRKEMRRG